MRVNTSGRGCEVLMVVVRSLLAVLYRLGLFSRFRRTDEPQGSTHRAQAAPHANARQKDSSQCMTERKETDPAPTKSALDAPMMGMMALAKMPPTKAARMASCIESVRATTWMDRCWNWKRRRLTTFCSLLGTMRLMVKRAGSIAKLPVADDVW